MGFKAWILGETLRMGWEEPFILLKNLEKVLKMQQRMGKEKACGVAYGGCGTMPAMAALTLAKGNHRKIKYPPG